MKPPVLRRRGVRIAVGIAVSLTALSIAGLVWLDRAFVLPEERCPGWERFNQRVWQDTLQVYTPLAPRGCMVDDLLAKWPLVGRDSAFVLNLLGRPQPTPYFKRYDLVYWLGPERGFMSIDSEWLVVRFDSTGRVSEARLVTD
jgi:hypothetical protein